MKPADLRPGHRIVCDMPGFVGPFTVEHQKDLTGTVVAASAPDQPRDGSIRWKDLCAALGMEWLSMTDDGLYLPAFRWNTDVAVEEA